MVNNYQLGYYAHSKKEYNTEIETLNYKFICENFKGHIICPNKHLGELKSIIPYLEIVKKADCVFTSEHNGFLGKGTFTECLTAFENDIPVYVIKKNRAKMRIELVTELIQISYYDLHEYGYLKSKKVSLDSI